jgi:integrase
MNEKVAENKYKSQFGQYISAFVSEKRGMGNKYETEAGELRRFDAFVIENGFSDSEITREIFERWMTKRPHESGKTHQNRFITIRQLCRYIARTGGNPYISPLQLRDNKSEFKPYIFTDIELGRFINAAHEMRGSRKNRLLFPMLFTLLVCTGLRIGEALHLERSNISFHGETVVLFIRGEKFNKDRLVPLASRLSEEFKAYLDKIKSFDPDSKFVFPAQHGGAYTLTPPYLIFRKLLWKAGISHGGKGKGPRIHDFRHTFAVKSLRKLVLQNEDMLAVLPLLCKYLGHKNTHSTQTYLTFTAEMFPSVTSKVEAAFGNVIPCMEESHE